MTKCDACAVDHVVNFTRPSGSIFAYCKRSKSGAMEGLEMRLIIVGISHYECQLKLKNNSMSTCAILSG